MTNGTSASSRRFRIVAAAVIILAAFVAGYMLRGGSDHSPGEDADMHGAEGHVSAAEIWTCSMHPQIRLSEPGKCPICFMDLIPVDRGAGEGTGERQLKMTDAAMRLADIETAPAVRRPAYASIRTVGAVAIDETRMAEITAWVPGRIERLFVNFTGASVRRGDRLAEIYSPTLISAQEELLQAARALGAAPDGDRTAAATLAAVREKLRQYGLTDTQIAEVEVRGNPVRNIVIFAPTSGVVLDLEIRESQYVKTGSTLMRISDLSSVWITLRAFQSDLALIRRGQEVSFTATALPGETFTGEVVFVDPVLDPGTMTAGVRAVATNDEGRLLPEMFVSGEILVRLGADGEAVRPELEEEAGDPIVIPSAAPLLTGKRAVVYMRLPGDDPVFEGREVDLGPRAGDGYVVLSGIEDGELVVTSGAFKIDSELQIRAGRSMMNPEGAAPAPAHDHGGRERRVSRPGRVSAEGTGKQRPYGHFTPGAAATRELSAVYDAYFVVQMALAGDDHPGAVSAYRELRKKVAAVEMSVFKGPAHDIWMDLSSKVAALCGEGAGSKDIAEARKTFYHLSKEVIELHEKFRHWGDDFFLTFCPMACYNAGAYWIQQVDTVYNSFYGAVMLRCGSIEKKLPPLGGE